MKASKKIMGEDDDDEGDFLNHLVEEVESEKSIINEAFAIDMVMVLLFATHETTSTALTLLPKFISDHPDVLAELTVCIYTEYIFF